MTEAGRGTGFPVLRLSAILGGCRRVDGGLDRSTVGCRDIDCIDSLLPFWDRPPREKVHEGGRFNVVGSDEVES